MYGILSIKELTRKVKNSLEASLPYVWVRGQVSNLSRPSSGHLYFTLKDDEAALAAVWFRNSQHNAGRFDPLTGEVYEEAPQAGPADVIVNGQEVICAGRLTVYPARGVYQLVVELAQKSGLGRLHEEYERLKAELQAAGYFAAERKRPLPDNPRRVALLTSPGGAALHDFLRVAENRGLGSRIVFYPLPIQGAEAPPALVKALRQANESDAQVIVIIRGGGSLEDLWAFNSKELASAIFESRLPVLAGIGHEVDFTLSDMTADVRAATPSHAAQLLWPERREFAQKIDELELAMRRNQERVLQVHSQRLRLQENALRLASPARALQGWERRLAEAEKGLGRAWRQGLENREKRLLLLASSLRLSSPLKTLLGWSEKLGSAEQRLRAARLNVLSVKSRNLQNAVRALEFWPQKAQAQLETRAIRLAGLEGALGAALSSAMDARENRLERAWLRLAGLNPMQPLERGYALARLADGSFLRSASGAHRGEDIDLLLSDGVLPVVVK